MKFFHKAIALTVAAAALLLGAAHPAAAQPAAGQRTSLADYVDRYKAIAVAQMERYGIPASITMAQGILESDCGNSTLSRQSNNHFGIKCKSNWTGARVFHDDDEQGECFRSYPSVEASYYDHAQFLDSQPRYDSLFVYAPTDYRRWAFGLKAAGYATAPDYAHRLIRIIEENELYLLDRDDGLTLYAAAHHAPAGSVEEAFSGQSSVDPVQMGEQWADQTVDPDSYRVTVSARDGYNVYRTNGVCWVQAARDDTYEHIAKVFRISAPNLRRFNEVARDAQPMTGEVVYIERKKARWEGNAQLHTTHAGETLYSIGQSYGIRTQQLARRNKLRTDAHLGAGEQIRIK